MSDSNINISDATTMREISNNEHTLSQLLSDYVDAQYVHAYNTSFCDVNMTTIEGTDDYVIVNINESSYVLDLKYLYNHDNDSKITSYDIRDYISETYIHVGQLKLDIDDFFDICLKGIRMMYDYQYRYLIIYKDDDNITYVSYVDNDDIKNLINDNILDENGNIIAYTTLCNAIAHMHDKSHVIGSSSHTNITKNNHKITPSKYVNVVKEEILRCVYKYGVINIDRLYKLLEKAGYSIERVDHGVVITNDNM